jgi:1,4-dihydroxy-2-naphthoyl-CoA hydrolase
VSVAPGWDGTLGIEIDELTATRVVAHLDVDERHLQPYGIVHGGVWTSIIETVGSHGGAFAAHELTGQHAVVGTSNSADFLRPHSRGRVEAVGTPIFVGRTQQLWSVEITRASDGKLLVRGQLRLQNLANPPALPGP